MTDVTRESDTGRFTGSMDSEALAHRGRSHTQLRQLLDARESLLHGHERETLLDAADALLFCEPEAEVKRAAARELLEHLVDSGRWLAGPAEEAGAALDGCGAELTNAQ